MSPVISTQRMTLAQMRDHVYFLADIQPSTLFPTASVDRLINNGLMIVGLEVGVPYTTASGFTSPGQTAYTLVDPYQPGKLPDIESVYISDETTSDVTVDATSATYTLAPHTAVYGGYTLTTAPTAENYMKVTYKVEPQLLVSDTDVPNLSYEAQNVACLYAVWQLKLKDDEGTISDRWHTTYDTSLRTLAGPRAGVYKAG